MPVRERRRRLRRRPAAPLYGEDRPTRPGEDAIDRNLRVNEQIRISPVRVINAEGAMLGVMPTGKAMEAAREAGQDLVEVAPNERPPVCKIMDFGKFKYSQKKRASKQKQHQVQVKEIRVRPKTGDHDIEVKVKRRASSSNTKTRCWSTSFSAVVSWRTSTKAARS